MLNSFEIFEELSQSFDEKTAKVLTRTLTRLHDEIKQSVGKDDFDELKAIVQDLAQAQKRTEARVEELAEAQKRTEARVEELAEAQKRTEARVEELAEAQKRTEVQIGKLTEAQERTDTTVNSLKKQIGGLSHAVGYGIEDRLLPKMKSFAKNRYGLVADSVKRCFVTYDNGKSDEVNLLISGTQDGNPFYLVGECKSKPGGADLKRFDKVLSRLSAHFQCRVKGFMVGYLLSPTFKRRLQESFAHIDAFQTYEIEAIADREAS